MVAFTYTVIALVAARQTFAVMAPWYTSGSCKAKSRASGVMHDQWGHSHHTQAPSYVPSAPPPSIVPTSPPVVSSPTSILYNEPQETQSYGSWSSPTASLATQSSQAPQPSESSAGSTTAAVPSPPSVASSAAQPSSSAPSASSATSAAGPQPSDDMGIINAAWAASGGKVAPNWEAAMAGSLGINSNAGAFQFDVVNTLSEGMVFMVDAGVNPTQNTAGYKYTASQSIGTAGFQPSYVLVIPAKTTKTFYIAPGTQEVCGQWNFLTPSGNPNGAFMAAGMINDVMGEFCVNPVASGGYSAMFSSVDVSTIGVTGNPSNTLHHMTIQTFPSKGAAQHCTSDVSACFWYGDDYQNPLEMPCADNYSCFFGGTTCQGYALVTITD